MSGGKGTTCPDCGDLRNQAYHKGMAVEWGCEIPDHTKAGAPKEPGVSVAPPPSKAPWKPLRPRGA